MQSLHSGLSCGTHLADRCGGSAGIAAVHHRRPPASRSTRRP